MTYQMSIPFEERQFEEQTFEGWRASLAFDVDIKSDHMLYPHGEKFVRALVDIIRKLTLTRYASEIIVTCNSPMDGRGPDDTAKFSRHIHVPDCMPTRTEREVLYASTTWPPSTTP